MSAQGFGTRLRLIPDLARALLMLSIALLCISSSGCRNQKKAEVVPDSIELTALDQPPDSESMSQLKNTVTEVVQAARNDQARNIYDLLAPDIRRTVSFYEFQQRFEVGRSRPLSLPEGLPEPDFSRVRDRVAEIFVMEPSNSTQTALHLDLLRQDHRWFVRSIVIYHRPSHTFHVPGELISPGSRQVDLFRIKEAMLQKALMTGKNWPDADGFPEINSLNPSIPVFVEIDPDLPMDSQFHVPGWTVQVVSEDKAIARRRTMFFKFNSIQMFGDLALGSMTLSHPDFDEGGGIAEMWLVRAGDQWRFYKYGATEIF